ncbi:UNKNOWN [Stylonychia lemnae]|uniref:Uncharacterized protein n=1 Tax=Stylonychia lemnae TaxID=5949 RepID=A0A078A0T3_STYLE|nr:UNKNOWN [Stylonychia lemnae]|eukprot:CDW75811.1 UNKNOWN [Stylonychia lemnae]
MNAKQILRGEKIAKITNQSNQSINRTSVKYQAYKAVQLILTQKIWNHYNISKLLESLKKLDTLIQKHCLSNLINLNACYVRRRLKTEISAECSPECPKCLKTFKQPEDYLFNKDLLQRSINVDIEGFHSDHLKIYEPMVNSQSIREMAVGLPILQQKDRRNSFDDFQQNEIFQLSPMYSSNDLYLDPDGPLRMFKPALMGKINLDFQKCSQNSDSIVQFKDENSQYEEQQKFNRLIEGLKFKKLTESTESRVLDEQQSDQS